MTKRNEPPRNGADILTDELIWALEFRAGDFIATQHTLTDRKTGQQWWVANGRTFFALYRPIERALGFWNRRRAWNAVTCWQAHRLREANRQKPDLKVIPLDRQEVSQ